MRTPAEIRIALRDFLGEAQYQKFVQQGLLRGRLRFWQEAVWAQFTARYPEYQVELEELATVLHICHLHGDELQADTATVFHGCVDYAPSYNEVRNRLFPWAALDIVSTEGRPCEVDAVTVWFCPACRVAYAMWEAKSR